MSTALEPLPPPTELLDVRTGEVVPAIPEKAVELLAAARDMRARVLSLVKDCEAVLLDESRRQGTKTLHFDHGTATVSGGSEVAYDPEILAKLLAVGLPDERWNELYVATVTYKVDARVAKQLEAANPIYARIIGEARSTVEKTVESEYQMTEISIDLDVRRVPQTVRLDTEQLRYIANTDFVPGALRGNLPAILACVATGREVGIGDMAALRMIHIIDGKPTYSAELHVMLARRAGHSIEKDPKSSDEVVTVHGKRGDNGDTGTVTFTVADAERAGLLTKRNWKQYPQSMLWARAVSQLCRELFPDVAAGGGFYTSEEMGSESTDSGGGEIVPLEDVNPIDGEPDVAATGGWKDDAERARYMTKLNIQVKDLREAGRDPTTWLYGDNGEKRAAACVTEDPGTWHAIRDQLTKKEAHALIDVFEKALAKLEAPA